MLATDNTLTRIQRTLRSAGLRIDTEEGRRFLQERLSLFGRLGLGIALGFFLVVNVLRVGLGDITLRAHLTETGNQLNLLTCGIFGALWLITRTKRSIGSNVLTALDGIATFSVCAMSAFHAATNELIKGSELIGILSVTNILIFRAVTVPSAPMRTFVVSLIGAIPAALPPLFVPEILSDLLPDDSPGFRVAMLWTWSLLAVVIATITSRVIYGLRQEVTAATQLGQYHLEGRIGSGGMGEVYRASHALLRRPTAVKLVRPEMAGPESLARFEREVRLTSLLTSPNTIAIYDYGRTPQGIFYYAMELLDGVDLDRLVTATGPLPPGRCIHVLTQVCASLAEAHDTNLIHRDVKPANIFLCERGGRPDVVKVLDFGLVKQLDAKAPEPRAPGPDVVMGTPRYMAPEAFIRADQVDHRSDLYALGAVGYFLLTGLAVFEAKTFEEVCIAHVQERPKRPSARLGAPLPTDLEDLLLACLEKDPKRRPADARTLSECLAACADADAWTDREAHAWWDVHRASFGPAPQAPASRQPDLVVSEDRTIRIDMVARLAAESTAPEHQTTQPER